MFEKKTTADYIYETIRNDIVELRYKPGEKLSEVQLAQRYKVSRAPVRDSLNRLEREGLVVVRPQIGTIISPISPRKIIDICQVRLLLEPYAAGVAAERITEAEKRELARHFDALLNGGAEGEERRALVFEADTMLHQTIWTLCGNKEIYSILSGYRDEIRRTRLATANFANRLPLSEQETVTIYKTLMDRDAEAARKAMQQHISNLAEAARQVFQGNEDMIEEA
ncbi:MAG: GntR family transcriptional regulator [Bacillota bacterium]|nr:GntR family transcriptional regulator [Bacillota bacterium]